MTHDLLADPRRPVRVALVGAGEMGSLWLRSLLANDDVQVMGLVDLDETAARRLTSSIGRPDIAIARSISEIAARHDLDAVVNVTVPAAHLAVSAEAFACGLAVLSEKPLAATLDEAQRLVLLSTHHGRLLMVSQSRRYVNALVAFKDDVLGLGGARILTSEFFKAPRFGGFRESMAHPLLVDMSIHAFDTARFVLDDDPVEVYCTSFNPPWSWYDGDAAASAVFTFSRGARFTYTGSWCNTGTETSWNGSWRASAAGGTVTWDGEGHPISSGVASPVVDGPEGIDAALTRFVDALRTGESPDGVASENIQSLAMVEAAVLSAETGNPVDIRQLLDRSHARAREQLLDTP